MPTIFVYTYMKVEELIKATHPLSEEKKVILNILITQNILTEKFNEILKPYEISMEQYNVLRILRGQKGKPLHMGCIQERMIAKTSNTTRLLDKLTAKGFATREICEANRRKMEVTITKKGLDMLNEIDPKIDEFDKEIVTQFSKEEKKQLNQLLEKFRS